MIYAVKRIYYGNSWKPVLCQEGNGPCPVLAVANVLFLRGQMQLHESRTEVSYDILCGLLQQYLSQSLQSTLNNANSSESLVANVLKNQEDALTLLPTLEKGLDVNVIFNSCLKLEYTDAIGLFDVFQTRLVHGWVYDRQDSKLASVVKGLSYNELVDFVMKEADDVKMTDVQLARQFLEDSKGQFTVVGLQQMHEQVKEGELCIFFRNNHFNVLLKRDKVLYTLVTDLGLHRAQSNATWNRLHDVKGDDFWYDMFFRKPSTGFFKQYFPPPVVARAVPVAQQQRTQQQQQQQQQQQLQQQLQQARALQQRGLRRTKLEEDDCVLL